MQARWAGVVLLVLSSRHVALSGTTHLRLNMGLALSIGTAPTKPNIVIISNNSRCQGMVALDIFRFSLFIPA